MPRSGSVKRRKVSPDQVYQDPRVARFINYIMKDGKKDKAKKIVYTALEKASADLGIEPQKVFSKAVEAVRPEQEVRPRRVGGATYQIPMPVPRSRSETLAMKWIIAAARKRSGREMSDRLATELRNAYNKEGDAVAKKENVHKIAEANRAFAHFRW